VCLPNSSGVYDRFAMACNGEKPHARLTGRCNRRAVPGRCVRSWRGLLVPLAADRLSRLTAGDRP
jgi:hypothetical protein